MRERSKEEQCHGLHSFCSSAKRARDLKAEFCTPLFLKGRAEELIALAGILHPYTCNKGHALCTGRLHTMLRL